MRVVNLRATPGDSGRVRLEATAQYQDGSTEELWIEVPDGPDLPRPPLASHWAVALVPLAATLGEALEIEGVVDGYLLDGITEVQRIWKAWKLIGAPVPVIPRELGAPGLPGDRVGLFFSGGVDSFHSLLRNRADHPPGTRGRVEDLILVFGADVDVERREVHAALEAMIARVARDFGARFHPVTTNLRRTRWSRTNWAKLSHGAFLAGLAHAVGGLGRVLIASSGTYARVAAWGSSPLTDPLLSSSTLRIVNDSSDTNRYEKLRLVARHPDVVRVLRVCWRSGTDQNCGRCLKCLRTMIALDLHGVLDQAESFPERRLDLELVSRIFPENPFGHQALRGLTAEAEAQHRRDLVRALLRAARSSARIHLALDLIDRAQRLGLGEAVGERLRLRLLRDRVRN